jgi:hypothetical protein
MQMKAAAVETWERAVLSKFLALFTTDFYLPKHVILVVVRGWVNSKGRDKRRNISAPMKQGKKNYKVKKKSEKRHHCTSEYNSKKYS